MGSSPVSDSLQCHYPARTVVDCSFLEESVVKLPLEIGPASLLFIDGPVHVFIDSEAPGIEIMEAYERLGRLVRVAACQAQTRREEKERDTNPPRPR